MSSFGGPRLILTVPGGSSRPNKTSSVKKSKFSKLSLMPFCQITAEFTKRIFLKFALRLKSENGIVLTDTDGYIRMSYPSYSRDNKFSVTAQ